MTAIRRRTRIALATVTLLLCPGLSLAESPHVRAEPVEATFETATSFRVSARRFLFTTHRDVSVRASVMHLDGRLDVELDRPVRSRLGVNRLRFAVRVLDDGGRQVGRVESELRDGARTLSLPLSFPAPGRYRLLVEDTDLDAAPARLSIRPSGRVALDVVAGATSQLAARR